MGIRVLSDHAEGLHAPAGGGRGVEANRCCPTMGKWRWYSGVYLRVCVCVPVYRCVLNTGFQFRDLINR